MQTLKEAKKQIEEKEECAGDGKEGGKNKVQNKEKEDSKKLNKKQKRERGRIVRGIGRYRKQKSRRGRRKRSQKDE